MSDVLSAILNRLLQRQGVHHAVLHVETGDGSFRWAAGRGPVRPGGPPLTAENPYHIASITKLFVAALTMRLIENGVLSLDQPIHELIPADWTDGIHTSRGIDSSQRITVRNLLAHTSGLPNFLEDAARGQRSLSARIFAEGDRELTDEEIVATVRSLEAHFEPQAAEARKVRYSDTNYWLLGLIIREVRGSPLEQTLNTFIIEPLGLEHTYLAGRSAPKSATLEASALWFNDQPLELPLFMRSHAAAGGLIATAGDTVKFMRALSTGRLFREPGTFNVMLEHTTRFGFPTDAAAARGPGWPIAGGLGIFHLQLPRIVTGFRRMPAVIGHTGSTGSWLFHVPEWDLYLAGTVDQAAGGQIPYRLLPELLRAVETIRG